MFVVTGVAVLSWAISQSIMAASAITTMKSEIKNNQTGVELVSSVVEDHVNSESGHSKISERLIKLESDVGHIDTTQSDNFRDIKDQLKIIQQDVKRLRSR